MTLIMPPQLLKAQEKCKVFPNSLKTLTEFEKYIPSFESLTSAVRCPVTS